MYWWAINFAYFTSEKNVSWEHGCKLAVLSWAGSSNLRKENMHPFTLQRGGCDVLRLGIRSYYVPALFHLDDIPFASLVLQFDLLDFALE